MKVLINRRPVNGPYGGGNLFVKAAWDILPKFGYVPVTDFSENPEVILMVDPHPDGDIRIGINEIAGYKHHQKERVAVIHRINECDARKATTNVDQMLRLCQNWVDERVFVSNWLRDHLRSKWEYPDGIHGGISDNPVIINGVDKKIFSPMGPGQNWTDRTLITTHHWSDNPMKGLDVAIWLDEYFIPKYRDRFAYTYIGRLKHQLKNSRMVEPCFGCDLGIEVSCGEIYISASKFDPAPNHILEALSCGLKTFVHADGGGAVEFAGTDHVYSSLEELEKILLTPLVDLPYNNAISLTTWEECIAQYAKLFDELTAHMP